MLVREVQPANAQLSMCVMSLEKEMSTKAVQASNARDPIERMPSGSVRLVMVTLAGDRPAKKAQTPILVTLCPSKLAGMVSSVALLVYAAISAVPFSSR